MAIDTFLKIDGIEGECADHKHGKEIQVMSWSWGESNIGSSNVGGGAGAGKVTMQDFHFTCEVSKASPKLLLACATGEHIKQAVLTNRKAGTEGQEYLVYKFTDILISSYQTGGHHGGENPLDQISFNYTKMEVEYKEQKPDGSLGGTTKAGYDLKANKKV